MIIFPGGCNEGDKAKAPFLEKRDGVLYFLEAESQELIVLIENGLKGMVWSDLVFTIHKKRLPPMDFFYFVCDKGQGKY